MRFLRSFVRLNRKYCHWLAEKYPETFGWPSCREDLLARITSQIRSGAVEKVLEAGGIDRPLLGKSPDFIYDGIDIEHRDNCDVLYDNFLVQSIEEPIPKHYDCIISTTLFEHVPDVDSSFGAIYQSLNPGGETHHYIPSKWNSKGIILQIISPTLQKKLIPILRPGTEGVTGYPTFFDNCSVPAMTKLLAKHGFRDVSFQVYYRANDYWAFFLPLYIFFSLIENLCRFLDIKLLASGFVVSARK